MPLKEEAEILYKDRIQFILPNEPIDGEFDNSAVTRALENLISNAFKYGDKKEKVKVEVEDRENIVLIKVWNSGEPIKKEDLKKIFKFFGQGSAGKPESWGIGLNVVDLVAKGHEGWIDVESEKEKGTTFTLCLSKEQTSAKKKVALLK